MEIRTTLTDRQLSFLVRAFSPYTTFVSFLLVKGFFTGLEVEADAIGIFPLLIPLSTLSPVRTSSVKLDEEKPTNKLKNGPDNIPINIPICSLSLTVVGPYWQDPSIFGCTL